MSAIAIKSEPDILEETISQSFEFIDEKPDVSTFVSTTIKDKPQQQPAAPRKLQAAKNPIKKRNLKQIDKNKSTNKFTLYVKNKFVEAFQQEGCSPKTVEKYANIYNVKVDTVNKYFDDAAKDAQNNVYQECDSLSFSNITEWLKYFQTTSVQRECNYDPAILMNAIANNEYHPDPESMGGINLKEIYTFLGNALMGLPQKPLDDISAKFLANEFQNLINEANTDKADYDVRNMKREIENSLGNKTNQKFCNLDPLSTDTQHLQSFTVRNVKCNNLKMEHIVTKLEK